jgi:RecA-family ATPase
LLGALLLEPAAWSVIVDSVAESDFSDAAHRLIFSAIAHLAEHNQPLDGVMVGEHLQQTGQLEVVGGRQYLAQLAEDTTSGANVQAYARIVREHAERRRISEIGRRLAADAETDSDLEALIETHARALSDAAQPRTRPSIWPSPLDLPSLMSRAPAPPRMILEGLPVGYATLFAGHGGSGKSSIVLHLACCIATGREWFGLRVDQPRRVLYLSAEDRVDVLHWRLARIATLEGLAGADLDRLRIVDLVGHDSILYRRTSFTGAGVTAAYGELMRLVEETRAEVLVVDGVSDTFGANENDRADVKQFVNSLVRLVGNNGAVILIHHVAKTTAVVGSTSEGYSGSTGWHNSVRARWYLCPETEQSEEGTKQTGALLLALQKSNLGRSDLTLRLRWNDDAHAFVCEGSPSRFDMLVRDEAERAGIVRAMREVGERGDYLPAAAQGPRTALNVLSTSPAFPETLKKKATKARFWRHVEELRRIGIIHEGSHRRANRHVVVTLELGTAPSTDCADVLNSRESNSAQSDAGATAPNASHSSGGYRGPGAHRNGGKPGSW